MYLGIDVGGTHTDGARLDHDFTVNRTVKVPTRPGDVQGSLTAALEALLAGTDPAQARRVVVSSTLGLNAILTGQADPVGVLATGGPGLPPGFFSGGPLFAQLSGGQDHRGDILTPQDPREAAAAAERLRAGGARAFAVISKFGPKNPALEDLAADAAQAAVPGCPMTRASRLAGRLNYPRRLQTAVYNSAVARLYQRFLRDLTRVLRDQGLTCPLGLLAADGGVLDPGWAAAAPVRLVAAGPAAGLLGLWSLADLDGDALMVDIGGTSTDLAVMVDGRPLMVSEGLDIAGRPTLVRAFLTHSVALGGDSALIADGPAVAVGPDREGPALALAPEDLGRRRPTLADALNVLGLTSLGRTDVSRQALAGLGQPGEVAEKALDAAMDTLRTAADDLLRRVNQRPVYTLDAIRLARPVTPARAALLGGPARALAEPVSRALGLPACVPEAAETANAVGAALARPTLGAALFADTALGLMTIPGLGLTRAIDRHYSLLEAENDLLAALGEALAGLPEANPPQLTDAECFNQLSDYGRADRIIRLQAQARPGVLGRAAV